MYSRQGQISAPQKNYGFQGTKKSRSQSIIGELIRDPLTPRPLRTCFFSLFLPFSTLCSQSLLPHCDHGVPVEKCFAQWATQLSPAPSDHGPQCLLDSQAQDSRAAAPPYRRKYQKPTQRDVRAQIWCEFTIVPLHLSFDHPVSGSGELANRSPSSKADRPTTVPRCRRTSCITSDKTSSIQQAELHRHNIARRRRQTARMPGDTTSLGGSSKRASQL